MDPQKPLPREDVDDAAEELPPRKLASPFRVFVSVVAVLLIFAGLLWVAEAIGLMAAVLPGGFGFFGGVIWGVLGLVGLLLVFLVLSNN